MLDVSLANKVVKLELRDNPEIGVFSFFLHKKNMREERHERGETRYLEFVLSVKRKSFDKDSSITYRTNNHRS